MPPRLLDPPLRDLHRLVNIAFALSEALARGFDLFAGMVKGGQFEVDSGRGLALQPTLDISNTNTFS